MTLNIAMYVSNHGFGHAARMSALAEELCAWGIYCHVICAKPGHLFSNLDPGYFTQYNREVDLGVVHGPNLCTDLGKTRSAIINLMNSRPELVSREVDFLRKHHIDLVISDAPFIVGEAAQYCNLPWFVVSNFDWYFIYSRIFADDQNMLPVLNCIRGLYRLSQLAFRLPFSSSASMGTFTKLIKTGLLARKSHNQTDIRAMYQIPEKTPLLLVMFGGEGDMEVDYPSLCAGFPGFVLSTRNDVQAPNHITVKPEDDFPALLEQCQVVLCKPGYSTFAEAAQFGKFILYIRRMNYPEEDILVQGLNNYPHARELSSLKLMVKQWMKVFREISMQNQQVAGFHNANHKVAGILMSEFLLQSGIGDDYLSVIDLGSHNLNYALYNLRQKRIVHQAHFTTGLSIGYKDNSLNKSAIKQTKDVINQLMQWEKHISSRKVLLATGVSRTAVNVNLLRDWFEKKHKIPFQILTAREEAELVYYAASELVYPNEPSLVFDIGGASTEMVFIPSSGRYKSNSLPIGLVRLDEDFSSFNNAIQHVQEELHKLDCSHINRLYGVGLTMIYLAAAIFRTDISQAYRLHGQVISKQELLKLQHKLQSGEEERLELNLDKGMRIPILNLSIAFCISLLDRFGLLEIIVCTQGISAGFCRRASLHKDAGRKRRN